jgi:hypothetical protein
MAESRIVLIPKLPADMSVDVISRLDDGFIVQVCEEEITLLKQKGIAVAELFADGNEFASAVLNKTKEVALQTLKEKKDTAIALLATEDKKQFGIA